MAGFFCRANATASGAITLKSDSQGKGMKGTLSAELDGGSSMLGEAALEGKVDARHAVLGAGGGGRGRKRLGGRRNALFTAAGAFAYSQSHWRRLIQCKYCAVRTQDVRADNEGKRETHYHQNMMMHHDFGDFNGRINISENHSACVTNANDFRSATREWLYRGSVGQSRAHSGAQHQQR